MNTAKFQMNKLPIPCWGLSIVLALLAVMAWVRAKIGWVGIAWGLPLSILITVPVAGTFFWLARGTQGRRGLLFSAFAWGASVAAFCSIFSQQWLQTLVDQQIGMEFGRWFRPLVITPLTEELFKGIFLLWLLRYRRSEIHGLLAGIVYGGLIGAGFAFSEQVMYFGQIVVTYLASGRANQSSGAILLMSFLLRGLMVPFMHSFFVAFIGVGVAAAAGVRGRVAQNCFVLTGFLIPVLLHGVWDWSGLASDDRFMIYKIYFMLMLPLFLAMTAVAWMLRRQRIRSAPRPILGIRPKG